jgi:hypothetical protein
MKYKKLRVTAHAWKQMTKRRISLSDVLIAIKLGRKIHRAHADFYFFGSRDIPAGAEKKLCKLVGMTVVVEGNRITTAYKNARAIRKLKRKPKRYNGYCPRNVATAVV